MKFNNFKKIFFVLLITLTTTFLFFSCSRSLGYSVLLWDEPESKLQDGQLLKVYFKSNISQVYIVGIPKEKARYEIPFWQVTTPTSKKKALKSFEPYNEYLHHYAKIKVDGLPVREEPANTSKQIYRLHQNEIVKILYKGEGQDVMVGRDKRLPGSWLCVLTEGGSRGWCFSYNLTLFETDSEGKVVGGSLDEVQVSNTDTLIDQILNAKWYPEYYGRLLRNNQIDLERIKLAYGFDTGVESGTIQLNLPEKYLSAPYKGVEKIRDKTYLLTDTSFQIIVRNNNQIVVNYSDANSKQEAFNFITLSDDVDISKITEEERVRRNLMIEKLAEVQSFKSQNYGKLEFNADKTFSWSGFNLLVPNVISSGVKGRGTVSVKYLLSSKVPSSYDGILTFKFENDLSETNFLYKLTGDGLTLESIDRYSIKENIVNARSSNPIVMFFSKKK